MIDQIISALKISLAECRKYETPAEYVYQLNMVLNRYKTNLFRMMEDKHKCVHDPKEFFQIRIAMSWRTKPGLSRVTSLMDNSPIMLHLNGFQPVVGERRNKENIYSKAVRIDDIIDLERIMALKTDHYYCGLMLSPNYVSEEDALLNHLGEDKYSELSMYLNLDKTVDDVIVFTMQLNSCVSAEVIQKHLVDSAERMADNPMTAKKLKALKAQAEIFRGTDARIPKDVQNYIDGKIPKLEESKEETVPADPVGNIFGTSTAQVTGTISASAVKKVKPFRAKNNPGLMAKTTKSGKSRNKNKYW